MRYLSLLINLAKEEAAALPWAIDSAMDFGPWDVPAKVMAIVSTGAEISDRKGTAQQMRRFPQAETQSIEADHWPLTENPEQTRIIIEQWCMQFVDESVSEL